MNFTLAICFAIVTYNTDSEPAPSVFSNIISNERVVNYTSLT